LRCRRAARPVFGHGAEVPVPGLSEAAGQPGLTVLGCYHPSLQNIFTGEVSEAMLDAVFSRARELSR
jgi:uracil-DNA glycosylase